MGITSDNRILALLVGIVLVTGALVLDVVLGLLALLSTLAGTPVGEGLLAALVGTALPYLVVGAVLATLGVAMLVALVVLVVRGASLPESKRVARLVERAERESTSLRQLGLSDRLRGGQGST